jgi:ABC-type Mn2+/Zn2+ transport system ATPase subunit
MGFTAYEVGQVRGRVGFIPGQSEVRKGFERTSVRVSNLPRCSRADMVRRGSSSDRWRGEEKVAKRM